MFFFGLLSTPLTYLLIVAVYICGYGNAVFSSNKEDISEYANAKIEIVNHNDINNINSETYQYYKNKVTSDIRYSKLIIKTKNALFNRKQIPIICPDEDLLNAYYEHSIISRPPPSLA